jgi:hypothetical protein
VKIKTQIIAAVIIMVLLIGIAVYIHGHGRGSRGDYGMAGSGYEMVGGYETGRGMMNDYGSSDKHPSDSRKVKRE